MKENHKNYSKTKDAHISETGTRQSRKADAGDDENQLNCGIITPLKAEKILKKLPQSLMKTRRQCDTPRRYISSFVRRVESEHSKGRCEFVNEFGIRCESRHQVQIDHIKPFSLGGSNELENLRSCCRSHNSYLATLARIGLETTSSYKC